MRIAFHDAKNLGSMRLHGPLHSLTRCRLVKPVTERKWPDSGGQCYPRIEADPGRLSERVLRVCSLPPLKVVISSPPRQAPVVREPLEDFRKIATR